MKERLILSTEEFKNSKQFGHLYYDGKNISNDSNYICFLDGYIVDKEFDECKVVDVFKQEGIRGFNKYYGQFNIIIYGKLENKIFFTNDFFAPLSLYYHIDDGGSFILSNSFWNIVDIINPEEKDIDQEIVAQMAIYGNLLDKNTIIKGVKIMETASNYEYDLFSKTLDSKKYDDYSSFTETPMTLDEATDLFHESIVEAVDYIKEKHQGEKIGISVSGGLDSRIVPAHFGQNASYFVITGPRRVRKWAKPYNFTYIDEIADAYGIEIKKVDQTNTTLEEKLFWELKSSPVRAENIAKIISKQELDFDVLLTSGSPDLLSSARTMYRNGWSMYDIMEKYQGHRYIKKGKIRSVKGIFNFVFVTRPNTYQTYNQEYIDFYPVKCFSKDDFYRRSHERIDKYTHIKDNPNDAIMIENYDLMSVDSSLGAFESIAGQMRVAYTYFYPWAYKVLKHVPFEYINQRKILKHLIEKYYPQVENIASEHSISGIHDESKISSFKIIKSLIQKKYRGFSIFGLFSKEQKQLALKLFDEECLWYDHIFDGQSVRDIYDSQQDIFLIHLKIKLLLSAIEHKDWKKFSV